MECAGAIVIPASAGIRKSVVGVVYELKFAGSCGSFWRIGGDAVWVSFKCCSDCSKTLVSGARNWRGIG